jgi:hypothetical protein
MPEDFVIARNPDGDSTLPYVVRIPLGDGILLKVRDTWPRTAKVYCHRVEEWPAEAEVVERVPVRSCARQRDATVLTNPLINRRGRTARRVRRTAGRGRSR